jgi:hypothetical protein
MKLHQYNNLQGCAENRLNRRTHYKVSVYNSEQAGIDTGDNRWAAVCEKHNTILGCRTQTIASNFIRVPWQWCEECRLELQKEGDK